jgi:hypothetical protein
MPRINEDLQLVGLIINMLPFEYKDNMLTANISKYLDINDLETLKKDFEFERDSAKEPDRELDDAIYFIDQILITLSTVDGNNI